METRKKMTKLETNQMPPDMEADTTTKTIYGKKPKIRKGYYPAQLINIRKFCDKEGKLIENKFGHKLIMEFIVFQPDKYGKPTEPVTIKEDNFTNDFTISAFFYYEFKQKDGNYTTAITPKSKLTKALQAMGWTIEDKKKVKWGEFINKWVELDIADYDEFKWTNDEGKEEKYTASTIKDITKYEGADPEVKYEKKADVKKELQHEDIPEEYISDEDEIPFEALPKEIQTKIKTMRELKESGNLTPEGYNKAIEQLRASVKQ
jgi:hypothetical protein